MKRTRRVHDFADIVDKVMPQLDGGRRGQVLLPHVWNQVVGEVFARQSCPNSIIKGVLDVAVSNANWLHELRFMKASILERLHVMLPETPINDIRFKVGPVPCAPDPADSEPLPELSPGEQQSISAQTDCIQDEELPLKLRFARMCGTKKRRVNGLLKNAHLLRYARPSSLRRT